MTVLKTLKLAYITYDNDRGVYQLYQNDGKDNYTPIADIHLTGSWFAINQYINVTSYDKSFDVIKINKCSISPSVYSNSVMIIGNVLLLKGA